MPTAISDNVKSVMSSFGVNLDDLNSTDLLAELVIDTFDQWYNLDDVVTQSSTGCGREFACPAQID